MKAGVDRPLPRCLPVLGCPVAVIDYAGAVDLVRSWAAWGDRAYAVEAANTHVVTLARHDPAFHAAMARFDLWLPDGMPLVWGLNQQLPPGERLTDRVYGPTFMLRCLEATANRMDESHFLLGGTKKLLMELRQHLAARIPGVVLAGSYAPPFGTWPVGENERIISAIRSSGARFVWVGLGCPKQERWLSEHRDRLPPAVYFGIGAAFAFHAGRVRQAPGWMQRLGLEWLFRLLVEPRRLLRRYVTYNSLFVFYLVRGWLERSRERATDERSR